MKTEDIVEVNAFKSPFDDTLFASKSALEHHVRSVTAEKRRADKELAAMEAIKDLIERPRLLATSLAHLSELLMESHKQIAVIARKCNHSAISYASRVAPILSVNMTARFVDATKGYCNRGSRDSSSVNTTGMYYNGNIAVSYPRIVDFFDSSFDLFWYIRRGTGGGSRFNGKYIKSQELSLSLDDFPLMLQAYKRQRELEVKEIASDKRISAAAEKSDGANIEYVQSLQARDVLGAQVQALQDQIAALTQQIDLLNNKAADIHQENLAKARLEIPNLAKIERHALQVQLGMVAPDSAN